MSGDDERHDEHPDARDDRWLYEGDPDGVWWTLKAVGTVVGVAALCVVLAAWLGCAAVSLGPDGSVQAATLMGGSVERCVPTGEAGMLTSAPQACTKVTSQSLPSAVFGLLGQAASAIWALF